MRNANNVGQFDIVAHKNKSEVKETTLNRLFTKHGFLILGWTGTADEIHEEKVSL
jgi:hypothetical protein